MKTGAKSALIVLAVATAATAQADNIPKGLDSAGTYQVPALESEVGGIYPHPDKDGFYLVAANKNPAYKRGQTPKLPVEHRGKLLTVDGRTGAITGGVSLPGKAYGGIASDGKLFYVSSLEPAEVLVLDLGKGKVVRRIALEAPAGGLEFDRQSQQLLAQIYLKHPHLAVVDVSSGAVVSSLWSDESAMDLKTVDGDLLCTWTSSFDDNAFSELRRIDRRTGKVTGRIRLSGVHSSMAPLDPKVSGRTGFITLSTTHKASGALAIQKFGYDRRAVAW
jgi:hypothetical protein